MMMRHVGWSGLLKVRAAVLVAAAAVQACGAGANTGASGFPTSTTDGGTSDRGSTTPPPATGGCTALCAHLRAAACGAFNEQCVAACQNLAAQVPAACRSRFDAFVTCAASSRVTCASDGPEINGCDAQSTALESCGEEPSPTPNTSQCLPDSTIPPDIAAELCTSVPATPVPHDCPGGAPSAQCVPSPGGQANVFCCAR